MDFYFNLLPCQDVWTIIEQYFHLQEHLKLKIGTNLPLLLRNTKRLTVTNPYCKVFFQLNAVRHRSKHKYGYTWFMCIYCQEPKICYGHEQRKEPIFVETNQYDYLLVCDWCWRFKSDIHGIARKHRKSNK